MSMNLMTVNFKNTCLRLFRVPVITSAAMTTLFEYKPWSGENDSFFPLQSIVKFFPGIIFLTLKDTLSIFGYNWLFIADIPGKVSSEKNTHSACWVIYIMEMNQMLSEKAKWILNIQKNSEKPFVTKGGTFYSRIG